MTEISQEAKDAIANAPLRRARERLRRSGAESLPAMQRRVKALAAERSIPPADYAKLMHKRVSTGAFMAFCEKHNVSTDWLLCGDLKGLQRMTREAKAEPSADGSKHIAALLEAFGKLDRASRKAVLLPEDTGRAMKRPHDIEAQRLEIERLQEAKRRALAIADERSKEAVELRLENERLRARLAERHRS